MTRFKLIVEYDGTDFVGWQRQANGFSIQQALEEAVIAFSGESATISAAGRTDAGVHALRQTVHLDLQSQSDPLTVLKAVNFHLKPARIAVVEAEIAPADFNARFSAVARSYRYRILNRRAPPTVDTGRVWHVVRPLDVQLMQRGAKNLIGKHDFTTFRSSHCQAASPVKTLDSLEVSRSGDEVVIDARARSFLHNQVRAMVGTLKRVGEGRWSPNDVKSALAAHDRSSAGPTAPACGLYLVDVVYPTPSHVKQPRGRKVDQ